MFEVILAPKLRTLITIAFFFQSMDDRREHRSTLKSAVPIFTQKKRIIVVLSAHRRNDLLHLCYHLTHLFRKGKKNETKTKLQYLG